MKNKMSWRDMAQTHPQASSSGLKDHKKSAVGTLKKKTKNPDIFPHISPSSRPLLHPIPRRRFLCNTGRKSFPGLESTGEIRVVQAHQRASRTISRWENRRALSLTAHVRKRNRGRAGPAAADLHAGRTGLDIENVPREQKKNASK